MTDREYLDAARELESTWVEYQRRIWNKLSSEFRMQQSEINLRMSQAISRAFDCIHDLGKADVEAEKFLLEMKCALEKLNQMAGKKQAL